jgi:hypothetical protein
LQNLVIANFLPDFTELRFLNWKPPLLPVFQVFGVQIAALYGVQLMM